MRREQGSATQSLLNVQAFMKSNPEVASLADAPATKQLDAAVADVQTSIATQASARLDRTVHAQRLSELAHTMVQEYMKPAAKFARRSLKGAADYAALTHSARQYASPALATHARAMATAAAPLADQFTAAKFEPGFVTQLGALADQLDAALAARQANTARGILSTKGIASALKSGREAVGMLDPVVSRLLKSHDLLAVWNAAKHVRAAGSAATPATPATPAVPANSTTPVSAHTSEVKTT